MRSLFIIACWILGLMSVAVGVLSVPFTLGFSLLGGIAGLVFFGGLAGFAEDLIETRKLVRLLYEQRNQSATNQARQPTGKNEAEPELVNTNIPSEATRSKSTAGEKTTKIEPWITYGVAAFIVFSLLYVLVLSISSPRG